MSKLGDLANLASETTKLDRKPSENASPQAPKPKSDSGTERAAVTTAAPKKARTKTTADRDAERRAALEELNVDVKKKPKRNLSPSQRQKERRRAKFRIDVELDGRDQAKLEAIAVQLDSASLAETIRYLIRTTDID